MAHSEYEFYAAQERIELNQIAKDREAKIAYLTAIVEMKHPTFDEVLRGHSLGVNLYAKDYRVR